MTECVAFGNVDSFSFDTNSLQPDDGGEDPASDSNKRNDNVEIAQEPTDDKHCSPCDTTPTNAHSDKINGEYIEPNIVDEEEFLEVRLKLI